MLREVINAVFVTYVASEWWLADAARAPAAATALRAGAAVAAANLLLAGLDVGGLAAFSRLASAPAAVAAVEAAALAAVLGGAAARCGARCTAARAAALFAGLIGACLAFGGRAAPHSPRILLAAVTFVGGLYADCARRARVPAPAFFRALGAALLYVAPVYPLLAVAISCVFLVAIAAVERAGLPPDVLDAPVYYGCLYGPFAAVYVDAKRTLAARRFDLPTTTATATAAGDAAVRRRAACADPW